MVSSLCFVATVWVPHPLPPGYTFVDFLAWHICKQMALLCFRVAGGRLLFCCSSMAAGPEPPAGHQYPCPLNLLSSPLILPQSILVPTTRSSALSAQAPCLPGRMWTATAKTLASLIRAPQCSSPTSWPLGPLFHCLLVEGSR